MKNNKKNFYSTILSNIFIWLIIVVVAISIANNFSPFERIKEISYTEYQDFLNQGLIESAEITGRTFEGKLRETQSFIDDFNKEENNESILEAISMIDSKIQNILSKYSIKKIDSIDEEFNPSFHEALLQKESNKKEGKIIEEYEKGYLYHDKIIRHAKVVVSKGKNK